MASFGLSPPEITSARLYSGPGPGPLLAAAVAYDVLAAQLESFAAGYNSVIASLQGESWAGAAAAAMAAAAGPYAEWARVTGAQVEHAASQARTAAAAYETARAAAVPPPLVTANRTQLASLVATNLLGQNTPQIAATEFDYSEMWAQDTVAMYGYATSASSATRLSPLSEPPQIVNPAGATAQAGAVAGATGNAAASNSRTFLSQLLTALPQQLNGLSAGEGSLTPLAAEAIPLPAQAIPGLEGIEAFNILTGPSAFALQTARTVSAVGAFAVGGGTYLATSGGHAGIGGAAGAFSPVLASETAPPADSGPAPGGGAVLASVGEAAPVGGLSAPPAWADATPVAAASVEPQWLSDEAELAIESPSQQPDLGGMAPAMGLGPMAGAMMAGAMMRPSVTKTLRVEPRHFTMPRPSCGG